MKYIISTNMLQGDLFSISKGDAISYLHPPIQQDKIDGICDRDYSVGEEFKLEEYNLLTNKRVGMNEFTQGN